MGRPEYDDATAGSKPKPRPQTTSGDATGSFQHGQELDDMRTR